MKRTITTLAVASASFFLGWQANDWVGFEKTDTPSIEWQKVSQEKVRAPVLVRNKTAQTPIPMSTGKVFRDLLATAAFEEAMQLYDRTVQPGEPDLPPLRDDLLHFLNGALEQGNDEALLALVDAYLSRHYDDIDVLMILAEYQRRQGYPDEAARVFQYAFTYALQAGQREKVLVSFQGLVDKTDAIFSDQQQWVELLGFYQLLESLDLAAPEHQLRQATICMQMQDIYCARELLTPLTEDIALAGRANELLAAMQPQAEEVPDRVPPGDSIPLVRRAGHHLVSASLNEELTVTLMIDTGASITSLSQERFAALSRDSYFEYLGWRLFNTANGVTRGNIYRAGQFRLGEHVLQNLEIAVLDFRQRDGVDGLLGMNVLQHFRFEIDQDRDVLYLQARRQFIQP